MAVFKVSASEFRVKMKDIANDVAEKQDRVVVTRHGGRIFVAVCWEDYEFLEKHKSRPTPRPVPEPIEDPLGGIEIDHPDRMETADIERVYEATNGCADEGVLSWRYKAYVVLRSRGRTPREQWFVSSPEPKSSGPPEASARGGR